MWRKKQKDWKSERFSKPGYGAHRGGEAADWTYGNVWTRVWRNRGRDGVVYFRVTFDRLERGRLMKNFALSDLDDVGRGLVRAETWIANRDND